MQKEAWVNTIASLVAGALCLLLRWLQNVTIYDETTGLARSGAGISVVLILAVVIAVAVLWALSRQLRGYEGATEPEEALASPPRLLSAILAVMAVIAALSSILLYFTGTTLVVKITALFGLLAVPALLFYPSLPRFGALGALLSLGPAVFFSIWLVVIYRMNAADPVLWRYVAQVLGVASLVLATYQLASYLFYRARPVRVIFSCLLAPVFCISLLMDEFAPVAARGIMAAWSVGVLTVAWLLICNLRPKAEEKHEEEEEA